MNGMPARKDHAVVEQLRFVGRVIKNPRTVGAVAPSSPFLARAVVAQADFTRPGPILELGPGSGAVTREILAQGLQPERLTLVERDPEFAKMMRRQFPGVNVAHGDAFQLRDTLAGRVTPPFATVISGLPLLNFPVAQSRGLLADILDLLAPGAPFIQFSYGLSSPVTPPAGASVERAAFVLRNIPPAHVWVYRKNTV